MPIRVLADGADSDIIAFCWHLCQNGVTRSYPLFQTQAALREEYARTAAHTGAFKAGYYHEDIFTGVVFGFAEEEGRYLQTTGFYVEEGRRDIAEQLTAWLAERFAGYTANIGLPAENVTVAGALCASGYRLLDDALDLRLHKNSFSGTVHGALTVRRVGETTLPQYLEFHKQHFGDCYWNAQRLWEHFADWHVYALYAGDTIAGGLFLRVYAGNAAEIYGLHVETELEAAALLSSAISDLFAAGSPVASVLFMVDTDDRNATDAALSLGFKQENHYRCYEKTL